MIKLKTVIIALSLTIPLIMFSQGQIENIFKETLQKKANQYRKESNFHKAQAFFISKNWDSTLVYSMKQLNLNNNQEIVDYCHYFRGNCFREKKIFKQAQFELKLISKKFKFYPLIIKDLGEISLELKEFEKSLLYFKELEKLPITKTSAYKISIIYTNIGISYLHLNNFIKAEEYFFRSLTLQEKEKDIPRLIYLYLNIANLYYLQYKDLQAIPYFEKAYSLSTSVNDFDIKRKASLNMAIVEENKSNYKKALEYRKESARWKDSLSNQNKIWAVADYEKKFAVAQKQKQIKVLEVENQLKNSQRNGFFFAAIGLFLILTTGVYLYAQKVKNAKIILLQKNKLDELNATKDQLFSIVSHDLRSSVNALKTSNAKLSATLKIKNYDELNQLIIQNSSIANGAYSLLDNLLHWAMLQTKQLYFHKESVHLYSIIQQ
ncbi:MAG: tetratricopeptide repeat protein, partial [Flavobacterium sp.]|uniref:tetratricopeptide repeat protein n=1 Tax=Flavobacterium sp. TaxID=239 RepID=UPI002FC8A4AA